MDAAPPVFFVRYGLPAPASFALLFITCWPALVQFVPRL